MSDKTNREKLDIGKTLFSAGGLGLILVILILINLIFSQFNLRVDATEDRLYSLSEGTRNILGKLKENVTIKVFYTKDNINTPVQIKTFAERLLDFLDEYEYYSDGKVTVEVFNPRADTEEEEWAQKYGINAMNLATGDRLYFGLVAVAADQEEAIQSLDPTREEHLEYDITRIITRVQAPKKHKIGIISGLPVFGQPPMPYNMQNMAQPAPEWVFVSELKKSYNVEEIKTDADGIEDDVDLLIMLYPRQLSDSLLYAVDQFVLKGGNAIVFADPMAYSDQSPGQQDKSSNPDKLFKAWGVKMEKNKLVTDFDYATRVRSQNNKIEEHPMWLTLHDEAFNQSEITTSELGSVLMPMAGAFEKLPDFSAEEYTPLIQSSANSAKDNTFKVRFGSSALRRDFSATVDKYDLAVKIRGKFKTAFSGGKPKSEDKNEAAVDKDKKDESEASHIAESKNNSTLILVADSDLLADQFYVSKQNILGFTMSRIFNDNLNFLLNVTEMLSGSEELISIRTRGKFERPFTRVEELEKKAQARWMAREQELVRKVDETNRKLREFEQKKDPSQRYIVSEEQEKEIAKFKEEKRRINKELKDVRKNLRADIERLGVKLKIINIGLMPLLVSLGGIGYAVYRRKKSLKP
jgi:ABC-type uncharacterized transport system involved in gliding motility auxiliary subunit